MSWNVEGYCGQSLGDKQDILYRLNADVIVLTETWSRHSNSVTLDGYVCLEKPRSVTNKNSLRASGGIACLIKRELADIYKISIEDNYMEEILPIRLSDRHSDNFISLFCVYLPPESSLYGENVDEVFEYLVGKLYDCCEANLVLLAGDFNSRIGDKLDYIDGVDDVPPRSAIDDVVNDHGKSLINFMLQTNTCVLNSRVCPLEDNYTSISHCG